MSNILLSKEEQDVIAFKFMKDLPYSHRMGICFAMLCAGLLAQAFFMNFYIVGCIFLFVGNLFLLVDGYDNRVKFGKYDPSSKWEKVDEDKFTELIEMQKKMEHWDRSTTDCSNPLGCFLMVMLIASIVALIILGNTLNIKPLYIVGVDIAILLIPHWFTGLRRITLIVTPALSQKITFIRSLIAGMRKDIGEHKIEYYMLLSGKDKKIPKDIKIKINIKGHHPDFMGLYGQIVMNNVQGTLYPYFYTVLVAKKGFGLKIQKGLEIKVKRPAASFWKAFLPVGSITKTLNKQKDVEVLVIRQTTTKQSGYNTDQAAASRIFLTGLKSAEINAVKK